MEFRPSVLEEAESVHDVERHGPAARHRRESIPLRGHRPFEEAGPYDAGEATDGVGYGGRSEVVDPDDDRESGCCAIRRPEAFGGAAMEPRGHLPIGPSARGIGRRRADPKVGPGPRSAARIGRRPRRIGAGNRGRTPVRGGGRVPRRPGRGAEGQSCSRRSCTRPEPCRRAGSRIGARHRIPGRAGPGARPNGTLRRPRGGVGVGTMRASAHSWSPPPPRHPPRRPAGRRRPWPHSWRTSPQVDRVRRPGGSCGPRTPGRRW